MWASAGEEAEVASVAGSDGRAALEALEEERDFCLRSLRDLEAERDAGDIDEADYEVLRDSYVGRAAAALRQLGAGTNESDPRGTEAPGGEERSSEFASGDATDSGGEPEAVTSAPTGSRRTWRTRVLAGFGVVVVASLAAWAVVRSSATRLPGQEITGQAVGSPAVVQSLQQAQQAITRGDDVSALKDYQKILNDDPNQPEALTGEGWLLVQTQQPALLQQGLTMLAAAERSAPTYAPAHVYRGIALLSEDNYGGAIPELQWYLAHNPDPQLAPRVRAALQQAEAKVAAAHQGG
jgi:hypothetical protein